MGKSSLSISDVSRGDLVRRYFINKAGEEEELSRYIVLDKVGKSTLKVKILSCTYANAHHKPGDIWFIKSYLFVYADFWEIVVKGGLS